MPRSELRPSDWQTKKFWQDDALLYHEVDNPDDNPKDGSPIPQWVIERRSSKAKTLERKTPQSPPLKNNLINNINNIATSQNATRHGFSQKLTTSSKITHGKSSQTSQDFHSEIGETSQRQLIKEWIYAEPGRHWNIKDLDAELGLLSPRAKHIREVVVSEEKRSGGIIPARWRGNYRTVDFTAEPFKLRNIANVTPLPIKLPLGISDMALIFKGMTIICAGDTGTGKTALMLHTIKLNDAKNLFVFVSEMGEQELEARLSPFGPYDWKATFIPREENFADIIRANAFNFVDWLAIEGDFWQIRQEIKAMRDKVDGGLLAINIQKGDSSKKYGEGGRFSAHYAHLYIVLDRTSVEGIFRATIQKATFPVNPDDHPRGKSCTFSINRGCNLEIVNNWEQK